MATNFYRYWKKYMNGAVFKNNETEVSTLDTFVNIDMARVHWYNLPKDLEPYKWYMNKYLLFNGVIGVYRDKETGHLNVLKLIPFGYPDMHGEYTSFKGVGENGYTIMLHRDEVAVCYENLSRTNTAFMKISSMTSRITDIQRTADERMINHKKPIIFSGPRQLLNTIKEFMNKIRNNEDAILADGNLSSKNVNAIGFDASMINNDLMDYKQRVIGEYLQYRGINYNPETRKKERLVSGEVNANNNLIDVSRETFMIPIEEFLRECYEKFPEFKEAGTYAEFHDTERSDLDESYNRKGDPDTTTEE